MQIENKALLELFMETICDTPSKPLRLKTATRPTTLAQQLGTSETIMGNLAKQYMEDGEKKLSQTTIRILNVLEDKSLMSPQKQESQTRLLDYVYPIV